MKKIIAILLSVLMVVSMVVVFAVPASAETIVVDGDLADDGWAADGWTTVTPDNGYWQTVPTTSDTLSYKYQLRSDDTKLYGAVIADCALVAGGNGTGTNVRLWLRTNDEATVYTHFYDINAAALDAKYNTKTDGNSAAKIDGTSLNGVAVENEGKSYFEFSVDLSEFGGKTSFDYFMSVSNNVNENVCLFYPVVTEGADRKDNLPYNTWDAANDITVNTADIALEAESEDESSDVESSDVDVPAESVNVALNKSYTGGEIALVGGTPTIYSANLTDGIASSEGAYDNSWFGLYYNSKSTEASNNCPDGVGTIIIDLEEVVNGITEIKVNTWNHNASGIAAASSITAYVSDDNETYEEVGALAIPEGDDPAWATLRTDNISAKFVKLVFVVSDTWTFINEIEVWAGSDSEESSDVVDDSSDVVDDSSDVVDDSSDVEVEETLEDKLIAAVGEANENPAFDAVISAPATYKAGDEIEVTVTIDNIA
ncbi:MAG: hypothetical protein IJC20_03620, partial [Clostridia bacterium]|nr:hypothetical protein [Clostridia bacterium]